MIDTNDLNWIEIETDRLTSFKGCIAGHTSGKNGEDIVLISSPYPEYKIIGHAWIDPKDWTICNMQISKKYLA